MGNIRQALFERYALHYERVGRGFRPADGGLKKSTKRRYDKSFSYLLRELPPGSQVLDLGCASGIMLGWLKGFPHITPVGVDLCPSLVEIARNNHPDLQIECEDGLSFLCKHPNQFGGIFCFDLLEHLEDGELMDWGNAIRNALRPGGFFCCRVPNAANLFACYSRYMDLTHVRSFTS